MEAEEDSGVVGSTTAALGEDVHDTAAGSARTGCGRASESAEASREGTRSAAEMDEWVPLGGCEAQAS